MGEKKKENSGLYGRVSTFGQNIEGQIFSCREFCSKNGFDIAGEYFDVGISGVKNSRPKLDRMMKDMRKNKFRVIIVMKLDRLGRSLKHLLDLLQEFRNRKVRLISIMDGIDTAIDSPMSRAFWQLLGVFAELEREIIRERVIGGLERAKKHGKKLGRRKGSKDKRKRSVSGYHLRYAGQKKEKRKINRRKCDA